MKSDSSEGNTKCIKCATLSIHYRQRAYTTFENARIKRSFHLCILCICEMLVSGRGDLEVSPPSTSITMLGPGEGGTWRSHPHRRP